MTKKIILLSLIAATGSFASENIVAKKLDTTIVTTERYKEIPILEAGKNVTVITSQDIENRGCQNIREALENVPSLQDTQGQFSIRGQVPKMGEKTVVVLVDGVPQNGMDNRVSELDFIPIDSVEKIEVLPSGGATIYGGNATAGVINIITKSNKNSKLWGRAAITGSSYNGRKVAGTIGTKINEKILASVNYKVSREDGYKDYTYNDVNYIDLDTTYLLENGEIKFSYSHNKKDTSGRASALTLDQMEEDRTQNSKNKGKKQIDIQDKYIINFNKGITDDISISGVFEYRTRDYVRDYPAIKKNPAYRMRDKNTKQFYANLHTSLGYATDSHVILGMDYQKARVDEKVNTADRKTHKIYMKEKTHTDYKSVGAYALNKYKINDFVFTQGIRVEKNSFDENENTFNSKGSQKTRTEKYSPTNVDYDLTATYLIDKDKSIYFSYNNVKRSPNIGEYGRWDTQKSPNKKAQVMNTFEVGTKALFNENIYFTAATYCINGEKEIMYDPAKLSNSRKSAYNFDGKTQRLGLELASEQYFDKLTLKENVTFMRNKIKTGDYAGNEIPGTSKVHGGLSATYEMVSNLILNVDVNYKGKSYFANDFRNEFGKYKNVITTNLNARYSFDNGFTVSAGVNNLFNECYCEYTYLSKTTKKYSPADRRVYNVGFEYKF